MSINYFDLTLDPSVTQSATTTQASILGVILAKTCRCTSNTNIGSAINSTIASINSANLKRGIPKIIVAIVGSTSLDNVYYSAEYARSQGITLICIAVGSSYNNAQLLQASFTQSNLIYVPNYSDLPNFVPTFFSFMTRQYIDVAVGESVPGNIVRSSDNPNYYRIPRNNTQKMYHRVVIKHYTDPQTNSFTVYTSHYDPFPDQYTDCNCTEHYRTSIYTYEYYV